jgi:hypothetical protein
MIIVPMSKTPFLTQNFQFIAKSLEQAKFTVLWGKYNYHLLVNPILTKSLTAGALAFAADLICQLFFTKPSASETKSSRDKVNWKRAVNFAILSGLIFAPLTHYWYGFLSTYIVGDTISAAVQRVAYDQLVYSPFTLCLFLVLHLCMEGKKDQVRDKLQTDWFPTLLQNYAVWIPAQLINFSVVPPPLRVLWANIIGFFWNIYLSDAVNKAPAEKMQKVE